MRDIQAIRRARFRRKLSSPTMIGGSLAGTSMSRRNTLSVVSPMTRRNRPALPKWRKVVSKKHRQQQAYKHDRVDPVILKASTREIIESIIKQTEIDGINLAAKVQDPHFRFMSSYKDEQEVSLQLSEAFATVSKLIKTRDMTVAVEKSVEKRVESADEFAKRIYTVVESMKTEAELVTNISVIDLLNERGIPTFKDAKWHTSTYNNMRKRWKKLGLLPDTPK